jgi:hypothetical protein
LRLIPARACVMRRVTCSIADRGGHIGGDTVPYSIGGAKLKGTSYVVLGTDVAGLGFNLLEPQFELGSRVVGEGLG